MNNVKMLDGKLHLHLEHSEAFGKTKGLFDYKKEMMVNKKILLGCIAGFFVVMVFSGFASAGLFTDIKNMIFGDPGLAPFEATVTVSNAPPIVYTISNVNEQIDAPLTSNRIDPIMSCGLAGAPTCPIAYVSFVARDPNGENTLNDGSIVAQITSPGPVIIAPLPLVCVPVTTPNPQGINPLATEYNLLTDQNYSCSVTMLYYYDPTLSTPVDDWGLSISISDNAGIPLTATCGVLPSVNCPTFAYGAGQEVDSRLNPAAVTPEVVWSSIDMNLPDRAADSAMPIYNRGNRPVVTDTTIDLDITAHNLLGLSIPAQNIPSERFSAGGVAGGSDAGACDVSAGGGSFPFDGTQMGVDGALPVQNIAGINLPYGPGGSDSTNIYLCIWSVLNDLGLNDPSGYSTTATGGVSWQVVV